MTTIVFSIIKCLHLNISGPTKHYCADNTMGITISEETTCFGLVLVCYFSIPMPGERPQYGIPILMTDERASQVSHSSWRTKASHNKSRLIPGPWAPPTRKTKRWVLLTKASYYSREPHVATLSVKLWPDRGAGLGCSSALNLRKSKVFSLSLSPTYCSSTLYPIRFFTFSLLPLAPSSPITD